MANTIGLPGEWPSVAASSRMEKLMSQSPIFTRTFDLLEYLLTVIKPFDQAYRFTLTRRLHDDALNNVG